VIESYLTYLFSVIPDSCNKNFRVIRLGNPREIVDARMRELLTDQLEYKREVTVLDRVHDNRFWIIVQSVGWLQLESTVMS